MLSSEETVKNSRGFIYSFSFQHYSPRSTIDFLLLVPYVAELSQLSYPFTFLLVKANPCVVGSSRGCNWWQNLNEYRFTDYADVPCSDVSLHVKQFMEVLLL